MKIGITSRDYERYGFGEGARIAHEQGFDCFDFGGFMNTETEFFKLPEGEFKAELLKIKKAYNDGGIAVWQVHAPWCYPPKDSTPGERAVRLEAFLKAVRGASYLGSPNIVVHAIMPFGVNSPDNPELMRDINAEFMGRLAEEALEYGVEHINVENLPFPNLPINHTHQCLDFVKRMNRETNSRIFKVCLDTGHSNFCGENPADAARMLGREYLGTLHVHDNDGKGDQHRLPGNGTIDWEDFSNALAEIGFDGCVSLETAIPSSIPNGEERYKLEKELADFTRRIARINN